MRQEILCGDQYELGIRCSGWEGREPYCFSGSAGLEGPNMEPSIPVGRSVFFGEELTGRVSSCTGANDDSAGDTRRGFCVVL